MACKAWRDLARPCKALQGFDLFADVEQNVELTLSICADSQWVWSQLRLYFKDRKINMGEFDQLSAYVCLSSAPQIFLTHF